MQVSLGNLPLNTCKRHLKKVFYTLIILLIWPSTFAETPAKTKPPEFPATLSDPNINDLSDEVVSSHEYVIIRPSDEATFSSETAASISSIPLKEGAKFQKGDVLLKLNCQIQEAELKKSQAQQNEAQVALNSAKKLQSYGSISQYEVVKATSAAQVANADVDRLNALINRCTIRAPYNGSIADIMVHEHETVKPGDPLLKIVNMENLIFEIQVPSCWLQWLHLNMDFKVHINETNEIISAKITNINPQVEPVSQTVKLVATIIDVHPNLLPGMSGQAIFPEQFHCKIEKTPNGK